MYSGGSRELKEKSKSVYTKAEVEAVLSKIKFDNNARLAEQKDRIFSLVEENRELAAENAELRRRDKLISDALVAAAEKAKEIEDAARMKYDVEIKRLKLFQSKWEQYFAEVVKRYPVDDNLRKVESFVQKVGEILGTDKDDTDCALTDSAASLKRVEDAFAGARRETAATARAPFDPKRRIDAYIESEGGFDLDEVLNPKGELSLEDLCRDLGLMD